MLADTLDRATGTFLNENKSPARRVGEIDNRGSHFYLALYWAAGAGRSRPTTPSSPRAFAPLAETLADERGRRSSSELIAVQGSPVDIGGYYRPDAEKTAAVMRPSTTFNEALASL